VSKPTKTPVSVQQGARLTEHEADLMVVGDSIALVLEDERLIRVGPLTAEQWYWLGRAGEAKGRAPR
jgi:hypothetical protein